MPVDPIPTYPLKDVVTSSTAMMYVNPILAGILLLEALTYYALLRRGRVQRTFNLPSLALLGLVALVGLALALAHSMWNNYAHDPGTRILNGPHFPPQWMERTGGVPALEAVLLTLALAIVATFTAFALYVAVFTTSRRYPDPA